MKSQKVSFPIFITGFHYGQLWRRRVGAGRQKHPLDRDVVDPLQFRFLQRLLRLRHGSSHHQIHRRYVALLVP